jgi:general L-amino acid transport system substrate-binding protein
MMDMSKAQILAVVGLLTAATFCIGPFSIGAARAGTLEEVRARGHVVCGVAETRDGLSAVDANGLWSGLEVEFCGAVAAAVLGDRSNVKFRAVSASEGPRVLSSGDVDVLLGATAWTLSREVELGMRGAGVLFHDGQVLLVQRAFGVSSVLELSGASICVQKGTGAEQGVAAYFQRLQMPYQLVMSEKWDEVVKAYRDGQCTLLTSDLSILAVERSRMPKPADHIFLPEPMSQELLGPMVRQGDERWFNVVRWTLIALVEAEQLGLSSANVADSLTSGDERVRRFLGIEAALGPALGLAPDWTVKVIGQVGNYGEIFDRTLGEGSRLKLVRGANNVWSKGGLMTSPSFR